MSTTVIVGAQWGDEGKGKIVDCCTGDADYVVRSQGGSNAGHTVIVGDKKYVTHLVPSGLLWSGKVCVIGNGVVFDPVELVGEMETLRKQGVVITAENLRISTRAHLTFPYHRAFDVCREAALSKDKKIGTTGRGIGPTYSDKMERSGLRGVDLLDPERLATRLADHCAEANIMLEAVGLDPIDISEAGTEVLDAAEILAPHLEDTAVLLNDAVAAKKTILFEGAQGTFLDIDHGTYPFVTCSNTTSGGVCTGTGVPPRSIDRVVGVAKAYTTRVGEGPFVSEDEDFGDRLHNMGREYGATTGRARRCGWYDAVLVRYASMINGIDEIAMTNLDGLDGLENLKICTAYQLDGKEILYPPASIEDFARCKPVYEEMKGWNTDTTAFRKASELPAEAKAYLDRLAELSGAPITMVGVGPARDEMVDMTA